MIVVDDAPSGSAEAIVNAFHDARIRYVKNNGTHGGAGARNYGIREAHCEFVAFLDDDDEWLSEKLTQQIVAMDSASADVGFCATAAMNIFDNEERTTAIENGVVDFSEIALRRFNGFLTSTLLVRRRVFDDVGMFDTSFPSHQEAELIIRITRRYKGIGINIPLVRMNMLQHEHIGGDWSKRILGGEMILSKHAELYASRPRILAQRLYWLGLWYRDEGRQREARDVFGRAWRLHHRWRYLVYWTTALLRGHVSL
jgi:glycosyltransferase involved in cell wall biosynthesis